MNLALWIVTGLLAAVYLLSGGYKVITPKQKIAAAGPHGSAGWVDDFSDGGVKAIGAVEILAALGLILPAVLDIAPVLVLWAAVGLVVLMLGAAATRVRRHETKLMAVDLAYAALAAFVVWGRFGPEPFTG
ncbi:DoxX family protein [Streptomyces sp. NPDC051561]|uniref:DoxX family protein n=1 Tax=Streptomyces sp. NPDC051561 TaxID=3365658 RepID=UPI0037BCFE2A